MERRNAHLRAAQRAKGRLKNLYPEMYVKLFEEEMAREGYVRRPRGNNWIRVI